jgi:hypothetical protein
MVNPPETQSPSSNAFSEVASQPAQLTPCRWALNELASDSPKSSRILVGKGKEFSLRRLSSGTLLADNLQNAPSVEFTRELHIEAPDV